MITHFKQGCYKCGYYLEVYLAKDKDAILHGFKEEVMIQCPNCGCYNKIRH